jgi:hypothetical protein
VGPTLEDVAARAGVPQLGAVAVRMVVSGPERGEHRRLPVRLVGA